jgi:hypothetical protein
MSFAGEGLRPIHVRVFFCRKGRPIWLWRIFTFERRWEVGAFMIRTSIISMAGDGGGSGTKEAGTTRKEREAAFGT